MTGSGPTPNRGEGPRRFARFACVDWSGAATKRQKGIAIASCDAGDTVPLLVSSPAGCWSRGAVLDWLRDHATVRTDLLVGVDFSPALPFDPAGGYIPGGPDVPRTAKAFWHEVERRCRDDPHLGIASLLADSTIARFFRIDRVTGTAFASADPNGRLRAVERRLESGRPSSCFNLVGARQVGRSSLTGMRVLAALDGQVPVWPFDALPAAGPAIVEIYTSIAAVRAGRGVGATKMRSWEALDAALAHPAIESETTGRSGPIDDHSSDAILTAAWLRRAAADPALWQPPAMAAVRDTEGWTFGVP